MFTFFELKEKLAVKRTVSLAGPKVGPFQICSPKGTPGTGTKYPLLFNIVHIDRDAEHRSQGQVEVAHMTGSHHTMICPPVVHHLIGRPKSTLPGQAWSEPGGRPGGVGSLIQGIVNRIGKIDGTPSAT